MDLISNLTLGLQSAFTASNLLYCFVGCLLGTAIGVLPGLGPPATIAMLLPFTFSLDATGSLIMLAGIYYGAQYGGSTTAILLNLPGEASSAVTSIDGYQMARQGKAGLALGTAAIGSFIAGTIATLLVAMFAPLLTSVALKFKAPEYFSLMVLGLLAAVALAHGSILKSLAMTIFGLTLGLVGTDTTSGAQRLTFGIPELADGLNIVAVAMGLYGLGEIIFNLSEPPEKRQIVSGAIGPLLPNKREMTAMLPPVLRGTGIGAVLGILPGGGALLSSFVAYAIEKKISKNPESFGRGALAGVAAPESANNAGAQTSFIPMLTLGIPSNIVMALMCGALIIQGIQPGPSVIQSKPDLFWGLIASMWAGNLMLILLNLPLVGLWVRLLQVPYHALFPAILVFCAIGVFTLNNNSFEILVMSVFGVVGYILRKLECESAPLLLGMVLGPMIEQYLGRSLLLAHGNPLVFITQPISAVLLGIGLALVIVAAFPTLSRKREQVLKEN